jgi:hypothetical protein
MRRSMRGDEVESELDAKSSPLQEFDAPASLEFHPPHLRQHSSCFIIALL